MSCEGPSLRLVGKVFSRPSVFHTGNGVISYEKRGGVKPHALRLEPLEDRNLLSVLLWDPQQSGGSNLGGAGTWTNGGAAIWYNPDTQTDVAWNSSNGDTAAFQGTAGTVTVDSSGVSAGGIEFDTSNYSVGGAPITLVQNNNSGWLDGEVRVNSTADTSSDSYVDSTAYIANLHATCVGGGGAGMSSLVADPAAANLAPQAPANGPARVTPCGTQAAVSGASDDRRALLSDTSGSVVGKTTSVAVGALPSSLIEPAGNEGNTETVAVQESPVTVRAAISTSAASKSETGLTTDTCGSPDRGLSGAAVDSLLSNGLDNLDGAPTLGTVATTQTREDAQA